MTSNMLENPVGNQVIRISIALGALITFAVPLRLLARWKSKANLAMDDVLIIISVLPQYTMITTGVLAVRNAGLGLPAEVHSPKQLANFLKLMMAGIVTYSLTITIVKLSILLLYHQIFVTQGFKRTTIYVGLICLAWFFIAVFMNLFQCNPFKAAFDVELLFTDECINLQAFYWGITAANLTLDVILLYLPLHMVWGLQLPMRQKFALSGIFMLGGFVCVAGAMRIVSIGNMKKEDMTVTMAGEYIWTQVEPATAIPCACIVTYRPLFKNFKLNLSKFSGLFSKGTVESKRSRQDGWTDLENDLDHSFMWPVGKDLQGRDVVRLQDLNAKAAKDGLHIVTIDPLQSDKKHPYTSTMTAKSVDIMEVRSNGNKPPYRSLPFEVTKDQTVVVSPFS